MSLPGLLKYVLQAGRGGADAAAAATPGGGEGPRGREKRVDVGRRFRGVTPGRPVGAPAMRRSPGASIRRKKPVTFVSMMIPLGSWGRRVPRIPFSLPFFAYFSLHSCVSYPVLLLPHTGLRGPKFAGGRREAWFCARTVLKWRERLRLRHFSLTSAEREPAHTAHASVLRDTGRQPPACLAGHL